MTSKYLVGGILGLLVTVAGIPAFIMMWRGDERLVRYLRSAMEPNWPFGHVLLRFTLRTLKLAQIWLALVSVLMLVDALHERGVIPGGAGYEVGFHAAGVFATLLLPAIVVMGLLGRPRWLMSPGAD